VCRVCRVCRVCGVWGGGLVGFVYVVIAAQFEHTMIVTETGCELLTGVCGVECVVCV
jgi:hypothetical protein